MPKRTSTKTTARRPTDVNQLAHMLVRLSTEEAKPENHPTTHPRQCIGQCGAPVRVRCPFRQQHVRAVNYFAYNFIKIHRTLRVSPAMAADVTDRLWEVSDLVALWESYERGMERAA